MNRTELIADVYDSLPPYYKNRFGRKGVQRVIDETFDSIIAATMQGETVEIRSFGSFKPQLRAPHKAFSGKARTIVMSKPYIRIIFSASKAWKRALSAVLNKRKEDE